MFFFIEWIYFLCKLSEIDIRDVLQKRKRYEGKEQECKKICMQDTRIHEDTLNRDLEGSRKNKLINKFIKPSYKPAKASRS